MQTNEQESRQPRRPRGSGSVHQKHRPSCTRPVDEKGRPSCKCVWQVTYYGPDGLRHKESTGSSRKGDAERLLQRRIGARENNLPVIPRAERLTFDEAARDVVNDFIANGKRSL